MKQTFFFQYWSTGLWWIDLQLFYYYGLGRAYTISLRNRAVLPKGERVGMTYGETPLRTFNTILHAAAAEEGLSFLELGAGTGRLSLVAAKAWGLKVLGVEAIEIFVSRANRIAGRAALPSCSFVCDDLFDTAWAEADLLYVTATTFTSHQLQRFQQKCEEIKEGAKLISLTHPPESKNMRLLYMDVLSFSWGATTVFIHQRIPASQQPNQYG